MPPEPIALIEEELLRPARALDIGCGTGAQSIYLAQHGFDVTGIDVATLATYKARRRAQTTHTKVNFQTVDFLNFETNNPYELAIDIGCLHSLLPQDRMRYITKLSEMVAPGGHYILYTNDLFTHTPDDFVHGLGTQGFVRESLWANRKDDTSQHWYLFVKSSTSGQPT